MLQFFFMQHRKALYLSIVILLTLIFPLLFITILSRSFKYISMTENIPNKKYHIIVTGETQNSNFLNKVFEGALKEAESYDAVVELNIPSSKADDTSLSSLFEYASFVNADGIIAYIDEDSDAVQAPKKSDGGDIPVITVGFFNQNIPQISFIGNNYSESGRILARTAVEYWKSGYDIFIVNSAEKNPNYSNLMNTLSVALKTARLFPETFEGTFTENQDAVSKRLLHENIVPAVIISLTEDDSISISQLASDPDYKQDNIIISFGENETISTYFEKGIISAVLSVDQENAGSRAVRELFNYKRNRFANNYVYAGIQLKKGRTE